MKKSLKQLVSIMLAVILLFSIGSIAIASDPPAPRVTRASDYLASYSASIRATGKGNLEISFIVTGVRTMDDIGAMTIVLKESTDGRTWTTVSTFRHTNYSNMMVTNKAGNASYVSYSGTSGRYYTAYVTVWAGRNGGGESRQTTTSSVRA